MPLSGSAFWALILPVEQTNLITNPSFERGTQGWGTIQAGTIGTTSQFQQFGAWSGSVAPTSNGTAGAVSPTWTAANGSAYTVSCYVRGANGIPYRMAVADSAGVNFVAGGTTTFTGGGTWHRYNLSYTEPSGATRTIVFTKNSSADTSAFYLDGLNVTLGSLSTHIDGAQDGCYWLGAPHTSQSTRSGTYRGGGSVVALADLGLRPNDNTGIGMPPQDVTMQSYALQPGAEYQRSRASERPFTLTFQPIMGTTTLQSFHTVRRTIINAIKPDLVSPQQPVRFWYTGGQGTVQIDAVYSSGLELGQMNGPMAEDGGIKFIAHAPYWTATTQEGTALTGRVAIGSANYIARRDPYGRWGTMGVAGETFRTVAAGIFGGVWDLLFNNGTLFMAGSWGSVGGTQSPQIGMYFADSNRFGTLTGGTLSTDGPARTLAMSAAGSLFIGGNLVTTGGTATNLIAQWNGAYGTLTGGTLQAGVGAGSHVAGIAFSGGSLMVGGRFGATAGTAYANVAQWVNGAWGTLVGGSLDGLVRQLTIGLDRTLYIGGQLTTAGGTTINDVAQWRANAWGSLGDGLTGVGVPEGLRLAIEPNGRLVVAGSYAVAGGGSALDIAEWNGAQWSAMGSGLTLTSGSAASIYGLYVDQRSGDIYAGGFFQATGARPFPDGVARWNGYTWLPLDFDVGAVPAGAIKAIETGIDRSLYIGGIWTGTAQAAGVTQIFNTGIGVAYPVFTARNIGAGTARVYQLVNTYPTGDGMYFDLVLQPGEEVTLTTEPGNRSFTSTFEGNVFGKILGGSNIASFRLMPGTNWISLFCDSGSVAASLYWTPRSDSVDGGTIY